MKNIYFATAMREDRNGRERFQEIVTILARYGTVLNRVASGVFPAVHAETQAREKTISLRLRTLEIMSMADIVIAEISLPSTNLGYEIAVAEACGLPVYGISSTTEGVTRQAAHMIEENRKFVFRTYKVPADLDPIFATFFQLAAVRHG